MAKGTRPGDDVFASKASEGELLSFPSELRGWGVTIDGKNESGEVVTDPTNGIPPMEWMNSILNKLSNNVLWNTQHAIPEWIAGTWNDTSFVYYQGWIYANITGADTDETPGLSTDWTKISPVGGVDDRYLQKDQRLSEIAEAGAEAQTQARDNLGCGTAATHDVQESPDDLTAGAVLQVGAFGVGVAIDLGVTDLDTVTVPGEYVQSRHEGGDEQHYPSGASGGVGGLIVIDVGGTDRKAQLYFDFTGGLYVRTALTGDWGELYSSQRPPPYPVNSVNAKTGDVALTAADVGALPDTYTPPGVDLSPYETIADADAKFMRDTQLVGYTVISAEGDNRAPAGCVFVMVGDFGSSDGYGGYSAIQKQINGAWYTVGSV